MLFSYLLAGARERDGKPRCIRMHALSPCHAKSSPHAGVCDKNKHRDRMCCEGDEDAWEEVAFGAPNPVPERRFLLVFMCSCSFVFMLFVWSAVSAAGSRGEGFDGRGALFAGPRRRLEP